MRRALALIGLAVALPAAPAAASNPPPIVRPTTAQQGTEVQRGAELFAANCSTCHGSRGRGVSPSDATEGVSGINGAGPSLVGAGALSADFYLSTGYMPLGDPDAQPQRKRPLFDAREQAALRAYVASLGPGPSVPSGDRSAGSVSHGLELFTEHCAGCHQVVGEGGVVTGAKVPPLDQATPRQVREAVRVGPYVMPRFSPKAISDRDLEDIVAYVQYTHEPRDEGGWGINHLGPFPEGIVTWFVAVVVLLATCVVIGSRYRRA